MEKIDLHQKWLGIPSTMRPLNHYFLLGLKLFEDDQNKIQRAYESRIILLKSKENGPFVELSQKLMADIGKAKVVLADPQKKSEYDLKLTASLDTATVADDLPPKAIAMARPIGAIGASNSAEPAKPIKAASNSANSKFDGLNQACADEGSELLTPNFLSDFRVWVALVSTTFVITLVTIRLLSGGAATGSTEKTIAKTAEKANPQNDAGLGDIDGVGDQQTPVDPLIANLKKVQQASDGTFELPIRQATLIGGLAKGKTGIVGWDSGDQAVWLLAITDRRSGFFNCKITYRSSGQAPFNVQMGSRKPLPMTIYPHKKDFEEEFIVKIDKQNEQPFRLIAGEFEFPPGTEITRVNLMPSR